MTERNPEQMLAQALNHAAPDDLHTVLSQCGAKKGNVIDMTEATERSTNKKKWTLGLIAAVLALVLLGGAGGIFYHQSYAVASVVSLDVNPSIELRANRNEKVLSCAAMNDEAAALLADMNGGADLKGTELDVAVNAIVGSLLRNGYLDGLSSAILLSVEDDDQNRAVRIQDELVAIVDSVLKDSSNEASVLSQSLTADSELKARAKESNISSGKAYLIDQIIAKNGNLEFDRLATLSVKELRDLLKAGAPGMPIGIEAAKQAALEYAGVKGNNAVTADVDAELDDPAPHYDVDLYLSGNEYEYHINAYTGEVLSGQKNILSVKPTPDTQTPSGGNIGTQTPSGGNTGTQTPSGGNTGNSGNTGNTGSAGNKTTDIGASAAKAAALKHAGLRENQVTNLRVKKDYDDGHIEYDVDFIYNNTEYEYTIHGVTGAVIDCETELIHKKASTGNGNSSSSGNSGNSGNSSSSTDIGAEAAKAAALKHAGLRENQVTNLRTKKDYDDGHIEYDVDFIYNNTEYEYTIHGATGMVLDCDTEPVRGQSSSGNGGNGGSSSSTTTDAGAEAAKAAALKHAGLTASQVSGLRVERDYERGRLVYEVEFRYGRMEYDYTIDAANGAILDHERDYDD